VIIILRSGRHEKLVDLITEKGILSTDELCKLLYVSQATIRRDINTLAEEKRIQKTHGGAMTFPKPILDDVPLSERMNMYREEKIRIATAALNLIKEGETYFLDSGTTTFELAVKLVAFKNITILTNDINIAYEISKNRESNLIVAGGVRKKSSATLMGIFTEQMLKQLHVNKAFISVDSINMKSGFMDYNTDEIPIKRTMIKNSRESIVLCDHTKFKNTAFMSICPLDSIDFVITGTEIDVEMIQKLTNSGINIKTV